LNWWRGQGWRDAVILRSASARLEGCTAEIFPRAAIR